MQRCIIGQYIKDQRFTRGRGLGFGRRRQCLGREGIFQPRRQLHRHRCRANGVYRRGVGFVATRRAPISFNAANTVISVVIREIKPFTKCDRFVLSLGDIEKYAIGIDRKQAEPLQQQARRMLAVKLHRAGADCRQYFQSPRWRINIHVNIGAIGLRPSTNDVRLHVPFAVFQHLCGQSFDRRLIQADRHAAREYGAAEIFAQMRHRFQQREWRVSGRSRGCLWHSMTSLMVQEEEDSLPLCLRRAGFNDAPSQFTAGR